MLRWICSSVVDSLRWRRVCVVDRCCALRRVLVVRGVVVKGAPIWVDLHTHPVCSTACPAAANKVCHVVADTTVSVALCSWPLLLDSGITATSRCSRGSSTTSYWVPLDWPMPTCLASFSTIIGQTPARSDMCLLFVFYAIGGEWEGCGSGERARGAVEC